MPRTSKVEQWSEVVKATDKSIASSTTMAADTELGFSTVSGALYAWEAYIIYASPVGAGTPDLKVGGGEQAGTTQGSFTAVHLAANDSPTASSLKTDTTSAATGGTAAGKRVVRIMGWHTGGGGTFNIYWAQATSGTDPTIVYAGSILRHRMLAAS